MGCCHSKMLVQSTVLRKQVDLEPLSQGEIVEVLKAKSSEQFELFKSTLHGKLKPSCPLGINEIARLFRNTLHVTLRDFESSFIVPPNRLDVLSECSVYKKYLTSKCKAEEGFFRYLNDTFSCKLIFNLHETLITEMLTGKSSKDEIIERFKKHAKGTFVISGLKKLYDFIEIAEKEDVLSLIKDEQEKELKELDNNRGQLDRASRKALLPVRDFSDDQEFRNFNESFSVVSENDVSEQIVKNASFSIC